MKAAAASIEQELRNRHIAFVVVLGCVLVVTVAEVAGADHDLHPADGAVVALVALLLWVVRRGEHRLVALHAELGRRLEKRSSDLEAAQQTYQELFDFCPIALQMFDVESLRFVAVNEAAAKLTGYSRDELLRMSVLETSAATTPDLGDAIRGFNGDWSGPAQLRHADQSVREVEVHTRPLIFRGRPCWMVASLDTTARHALERQLSQAQRMDAVGRLACGVAHEFNDMLSVLLGYTDLLLEDCSPDDPTFTPLTEMKRAGERASDVSRRLLTFSRLQPGELQVVDVNDAVRSVKALLDDTVAPCVLAVRLASQNCETRADPEQIEQIILNLVSNARDAMPDGGTIIVETGLTHEPLTASGESERRVVLAVRDSGPGIPPDIRSRVFEPFFITKPQGRGTGLGLSIVYGIVEQCGGVISVETPAGGGTEITISLPFIDSGETSRGARPSVAARSGASVLLVAGESVVATAAQSELARCGHRVITARDAGEAAILLEENIDDIEVLLTEPTLGSISGAELARRLQLASPRLKTLYLPEHAEGGVVCGSERDHETPITPRALSRRLQAILENTGAMESHASQ